MYEVQTTQWSKEQIGALMAQPNKAECIHNVYKLAIIECTLSYLHASEGHPVEETWLNAIAQEN